MLWRLLLPGYLGKQYSLILLICIDLYIAWLFPTKDLRKLITKTIQWNLEFRKANAGRDTFPERP